ncbi:MAG: hypothetical protein IIX54_07160, partial [Clostridia bacterium]|nr:hypothetical protein [Clostridia bacterium]
KASFFGNTEGVRKTPTQSTRVLTPTFWLVFYFLFAVLFGFELFLLCKNVRRSSHKTTFVLYFFTLFSGRCVAVY